MAAAKGYKDVGGQPQRCWSRTPTLGCVCNGLNLLHSLMGQNRVTQHHEQKKVSVVIG